MKSCIEGILEIFAQCTQVEAIAMGGSRGSGNYDETSDYDLYLYVNRQIPEEERRNILQQFCQVVEVGNQYWEYEDNCTMKDGIDLDIIYRNLQNFEKEIAEVVTLCHSRNGYTTCMWNNLLFSRIVFDRTGAFAALQQKYRIPYPSALKKNIIEKNRKLLNGVLPSYDRQIEKAFARNDLVSINHRVTEFLASYFDILFAYNELTHVGEKKLAAICKEKCQVLPGQFEENLSLLFSNMYRKDISTILERMVVELDRILSK